MLFIEKKKKRKAQIEVHLIEEFTCNFYRSPLCIIEMYVIVCTECHSTVCNSQIVHHSISLFTIHRKSIEKCTKASDENCLNAKRERERNQREVVCVVRYLIV